MYRNVVLLLIAFVMSAVPAFARSAPAADAMIPDLAGVGAVRLGRVNATTLSARIAYLEERLSDGVDDREAIRSELARLRLAEQGEVVVSRILARLAVVDPSIDVTSRQFTLAFDLRREFAGEPESYLKSMENSYMFTLPGRSSQIYLNATTELFKRVADNDADWITLAATVVIHECQHLEGTNWEDRSEHTAFRKQLVVLDRLGPAAFKSKGFYTKMSNFVKKGAAAGA